MANIKFKRGATVSSVTQPALEDGSLLFATESGKIYLDDSSSRTEFYSDRISEDEANSKYIQMQNGATTTIASSLQVEGINNIEFTEEEESGSGRSGGGLGIIASGEVVSSDISGSMSVSLPSPASFILMQVVTTGSFDNISLSGFFMLTPNDTYSDLDTLGSEIGISFNESGDALNFTRGATSASNKSFKYIALG